MIFVLSIICFHADGHLLKFQEITMKIQRQQNVIYRTSIQADSPWKLQQVQDAGNHLQHALQHIESVDPDYSFRSSEEVLHLLGDILGCLQRGRTSLIVPRKRTIDDLMKSRNMVFLLLSAVSLFLP